jgi:hypothetical protein
MADRKSYLLRIDAGILDQIRRWADDDLRSLNGQIEFLLRKALRESGRMKEPAEAPEEDTARRSDSHPLVRKKIRKSVDAGPDQ